VSLLNFYGFAMAVIYVGAGMYILIASNIFNFSNLQKFGFGTILVVYGLVRFYVALKKKRESEIDENQN
jgi:uncharacterized membrane protein